jgi:hypothetical protein
MPQAQTPVGVDTSTLFHEDEKTMNGTTMRSRPVQRTQMGAPRPRRNGERTKRRPVLEWAKAILLSLAVVSGFLMFVSNRKSLHEQRESANFEILDRCNLITYPHWQIENLEELNLSGCYYVSLPADTKVWSRFSSLKKLDLNNNSLTDLPDEMKVLSSLEILFLSENKLESVPSVISKLIKLRVLSLRGNLLRELSASYLPNSSLVWLILTNNHISKLHANIGDATLLRKLMLSHNRIESVPVELGECRNLELIRLANNNISSMPREVLMLPKLAWISLSGNPIFTPPTKLTNVIKESDIQMQSIILGQGASGTVYKGSYNGEDVAIKIFKEGSKGSDGNAIDEARINGLIDHPFAISAIGVFMDGQKKSYKGMVMNLLSGTYPLGKVPNFDTVTRDEGPSPQSTNLSKNQVYSVVWNIASVLEYIHSSVGVSHSDVYLHNVLRDGQFVARLSDWGASFAYRENLELAGMLERIEVLAFGRLVQDLFDWHLGVAVPDTTTGPEFYFDIFRTRNQLEEGGFKELLASILQPDQASRPTFRAIKEKLGSISQFRELRS